MSTNVFQEMAARRIRNPESWISCQLSLLLALICHFSTFIQEKHWVQPEKKIQHMCSHTEKHCLQILSLTVIDDFYLQTLETHGLYEMLFKSQLDRPLSLKKRERERETACAFFVSEEFRRGRLFAMNGFGSGALTQGFSAAALPAKMAAFACVSSVGRTYRGETQACHVRQECYCRSGLETLHPAQSCVPSK